MTTQLDDPQYLARIKPDQVKTFIDGLIGIHFRVHNTEPDKYVVVKLYKHFSQDILTMYLASLGVLDDAELITGAVKHIAIIERDVWENATEQKVEEDVEGKVEVCQNCNNGNYSLDDQATSVTVQTGNTSFTLDIMGEETEQAFQGVYLLD